MPKQKPYIRYRIIGKYQCTEIFPLSLQLKYIRPDNDVVSSYCTLTKTGLLTPNDFYQFDGPSGPTKLLAAIPWFGRRFINKFFRGSYFHDMLYQLMRNKLLPWYYWELADRELEEINKVDGMIKPRRWWVTKGLKIAGGKAALPENVRKEYTAPI